MSRADGLDAGLNLPHSLVPRGEGMISRDIREDSRLNATELLAWFVQAGVAEMPEVSYPFHVASFPSSIAGIALSPSAGASRGRGKGVQ
jgi:hypothetical protein